MKKISTILLVLALVFCLVACSGAGVETGTAQVPQNVSVVTAAETTLKPEAGVQDTQAPADDMTTVQAGASSVAEAMAQNSVPNEAPEDMTWDIKTAIPIRLNGNTIAVDGMGVAVEGNHATITSAGTYVLSGVLTDGQITVDTQDKDNVRLVLNGVDIRNSDSPPIIILNAKKTIIILASTTQNYVADGAGYTSAGSEEDVPNAVIYSTGDLLFYGDGSLIVEGNGNDGIASKDGLIIAGGMFTVHAVDDGLRGKDYLVIKEGVLTIVAGGDGLKSDNDKDATRGYVLVEGGVINITSAGDAVAAGTDALVKAGEITITSGGGSDAVLDQSKSAKGIKAATHVIIDGGSLNINAADDAIHSNDSLTVNGGTFEISTGDDGMHADGALMINNGQIRIANSYEGLEGAQITINDGTISIVARDDGINAAGGNDGSGFGFGGGGMLPQGDMPGERPETGQRPGGVAPQQGHMPAPDGMADQMPQGGMQAPGGGGMQQDGFMPGGNYHLTINGGTIMVDASGDGLDINGSMDMTGGTVIVNGPTVPMNAALDYDGTFNISGGFFVTAGSAGMAMAPSDSSSQYAVMVNFDSVQPAGTLLHIQNHDGKDILTFTPVKEYQSITFSSPELASGSTYDIYLGGSSTGTALNGWYQDGVYAPGSLNTSFTISGMVTKVGKIGGFRPQ